MRNRIILVISFYLIGCNYKNSVKYPDKDNFYDRDLYENDVVRLPIYYPYELISAAGVSQLMVSGGSELYRKFGISGIVDSIAVSGEIISLHGDFNMVGNDIYAILYNDTIIYAKTHAEFSHICFKVKTSDMLSETKSVYDNWMQNGVLPWTIKKQEIKE